jgi:hypothetical protein
MCAALGGCEVGGICKAATAMFHRTVCTIALCCLMILDISCSPGFFRVYLHTILFVLFSLPVFSLLPSFFSPLFVLYFSWKLSLSVFGLLALTILTHFRFSFYSF